ncbi:MAG: D-aminoacylase [Burkholderiales bacterium]|nr:D-aminoacylase [Burkholderiales bacterium]
MTDATTFLIHDGLLLDGSGAPGAPGDLLVERGRIAAVGHVPPEAARQSGLRRIDARGLVVAPGFIDIKTHSDFVLPINPTADSKVRQGVTTEIIGHCGFSVAPVLPGKTQLLADYLSPSAPWLPFREMGFPEYLDTFPATSVNAGMLVGHNTLRLMVMGMERRAPTAVELDRMCRLLREGLEAGALGLSSGLFTSPGSYAQADEMLALCRVLEPYGAAYFTHLRDESAGVLDALQEAIDIAAQCRVHVQVVHFKCSGLDNWGRAKTALEMLAAAKARGLSIDCDAYPYTAGSNPLKNLMPQWVQDGGVQAMLARLPEAATRARIRADIERDGLNNWGRIPSWDCVRVSISPHLPQYATRTIADIASEWDLDPLDAACEYLLRDQGATRVLVTSISEDDIDTLVRTPWTLVGSDGNCVAHHGVTGQGMPHPRFYGTFPRILSRYVRERRLIPIEQAVHKMTGATAAALRLADRGLLRAGWRADLVLFDPDDFDDRATYADPHQYPSGPRTTVLVNGVPVVEGAAHTGATPGRVLRRDAHGRVA